jgi:hypothetical protein
MFVVYWIPCLTLNRDEFDNSNFRSEKGAQLLLVPTRKCYVLFVIPVPLSSPSQMPFCHLSRMGVRSLCC